MKRIVAAYGECARRFALTNGEWFFVFRDLNATFWHEIQKLARLFCFLTSPM